MSIEIVTHCYAKNHPHFADCLFAQLTSLDSFVYSLSGHITVCCNEEDKHTKKVLKRKGHLVTPLYMDIGKLGRRSIGRNERAKKTNTDIIWFTDVDHLFLDGILERLKNFEWPDNTTMVYPSDIMISKGHKIGDAQLLQYRNDPKQIFHKKDFIPKHYSRAIGGVQIVQGDFARKYGYLDGNRRWMKPVEKPFGDFRDDMAYRGFCQSKGRVIGIDLPGIYRIRHSETSYQ